MGVCHLHLQPLRSEGRRVGVQGHLWLHVCLQPSWDTWNPQTKSCFQDAVLWYPVSQLAFGSCLLFYLVGCRHDICTQGFIITSTDIWSVKKEGAGKEGVSLLAYPHNE